MFGRPFLIRMCVRKQEASARVPGSSVHCNPTALKYTCGVVRRLAASNLKHHFPDHLESFRNTLPWHIWPASLFLGRCGKKQSSLNLCQVDLFNGFIWKKGVQPPWRVLVLDAAHAPNHQNTMVGSQQWHPLRVLLPLFLRPVCLSLQD